MNWHWDLSLAVEPYRNVAGTAISAQVLVSVPQPNQAFSHNISSHLARDGVGQREMSLLV